MIYVMLVAARGEHEVSEHTPARHVLNKVEEVSAQHEYQLLWSERVRMPNNLCA